MEKGFKELKIWQKAKELAVSIYKETDIGLIKNDYGLKDQMRRSSVSIASNIAEGDERGTNREAVRFFHISKGSLAELRTQLQISFEVGYLIKQDYDRLENECKQIGKMLGKIIEYRKEKTVRKY